MPTGSLELRITDLLDSPVEGELDFTFEPAGNSPGGTSMEASFSVTTETDFTVSKIQCRRGPGTHYTVRATSRNFRPYAFFQMILEQKVNTPTESQIRFAVNPRRVRDISASVFSALAKPLRDFVEAANMQDPKQEDRDL